MHNYITSTALATLLLGACAHADNGNINTRTGAPGDPYQLVSDLVALPEFLPGMGKLYVDPNTLPAGPFLAYDRNEKLVSTVYMIPLEAMNQQQAFSDLVTPQERVVSVDIAYNPGHPGVAEPHYHITLYHVDPTTAALE